MHIRHSALKQIIKEELAIVLAEKRLKQDSPSNPYHRGRSGSTAGQFSSYDNSKSWSLDGKKHKMKSGKPAAPCGRGERKRCSDSSLKWESTEEPRIDSSSDFRRDDKRYKNDRMRKDERFPGYDDFTRLANGIVEEIDEVMNQLDEKKQSKQCFNREQMMALRQSIFNQIMGFINTYENVKKNTNPKQRRA